MAPGLIEGFRVKWKRNTAFLVIGHAACWYAYDYTVTSDIMRVCCKRAALYGDAKLRDPNQPTRHITVILNPVAGKRKTKKLYTKWVEPILNLAGIKVSLVETESPNQAYDLMKIMSNCDGVAIVGGDGTVHEVLNGLLHRRDNLQAVKKFPIGIMPTGQVNSIARYIHQSISYRNQKELLMHSTLRLVESCTEKYDVLEINSYNVDDKASPSSQKLPIYALRDIRYGLYQDSFNRISNFSFWQSYVKPVWQRLQRLFSSKYQRPQIESLLYTEPCIGCSRCIEKHKLRQPTDESQINNGEPGEILSQEKSANRRWWSVLAPIPMNKQEPNENELKELELSKRDNPECNRYKKVAMLENISDFRACMMGEKSVRLSLARNGEYTPSEIIEAQDVRLKLPEKLDKEFESTSREQRNQTSSIKDESESSSTKSAAGDSDKVVEENEKNQTKFLVDGQAIQARSINIKAISEPITIFTGVMPIHALDVPSDRPRQ